jgi:hypothetical protein
MAGNTNPIYSAYGDVQGGDILTIAANEYTGQSNNNAVVFSSDINNGGFVQRIRFKALGTNASTVARIYFNNGHSRFIGQAAAPTGTPTGAPSTSGGTLLTGTYFAKIVSVDQYLGRSVPSTETASVSVTGPTGSIVWSWNAVTTPTAAASYRIYVGPVAGGQLTYFTSNTNSFTQTTAIGTRDSLSTSISNNNSLIGEISLPGTTVSALAATVDIDYPLNFALPPGGRLIVGLGTTVSAGWMVTAIGGEY